MNPDLLAPRRPGVPIPSALPTWGMIAIVLAPAVVLAVAHVALRMSPPTPIAPAVVTSDGTELHGVVVPAADSGTTAD